MSRGAIPDENRLHALLERTGYPLVQENGQRKYGPPPTWEGPPPPKGCEIFVGKIPRHIYEDDLIPLFEKVAPLYEFRLMMDFSGTNRGYAFCMYTNQADAERAVTELNEAEVIPGRRVGVCMSLDNCRLCVHRIPEDKTRADLLRDVSKVPGVIDVIVYPMRRMSKGWFAVLEFDSHRTAAKARRQLMSGLIQLWDRPILVDWAPAERETGQAALCMSHGLETPPSTAQISEPRQILPRSEGVNRMVQGSTGPSQGVQRENDGGAAGSHAMGENKIPHLSNSCIIDFHRHPAVVLEEFCQKKRLGRPVFELHSAMQRKPWHCRELQLYFFKVYITGGVMGGMSCFHPDRLCDTVEKARTYAARFTLQQLAASLHRVNDQTLPLPGQHQLLQPERITSTAPKHMPATQHTVYSPPATPHTVYRPPATPHTVYRPPATQHTVYSPPATPHTVYSPPATPHSVYSPPATQHTVYSPPATQYTVHSPPAMQHTVYSS